jgi:hypothetical protein
MMADIADQKPAAVARQNHHQYYPGAAVHRMLRTVSQTGFDSFTGARVRNPDQQALSCCVRVVNG